MRNMSSATAEETMTRMASSVKEETVPPRTIPAVPIADPNNASPEGRPTTINSTRMTCTMATPRISAWSSAESAITCAMEPGLAPSKADSASHPCTQRR